MSWEEWRPARRTTMAPPSSLHSRTAPGPTPRRRRTAAGTDTWPCAVSFEWAIGDININYHGNVRQSTVSVRRRLALCRDLTSARPTLGVAPALAPRPALSRSSNSGRSAAADLRDDPGHEQIGQQDRHAGQPAQLVARLAAEAHAVHHHEPGPARAHRVG